MNLRLEGLEKGDLPILSAVSGEINDLQHARFTGHPVLPIKGLFQLSKVRTLNHRWPSKISQPLLTRETKVYKEKPGLSYKGTAIPFSFWILLI